MKKSVLSLTALVLVSASSLTASGQSTVGTNAVSGSNPRPQAVSGSNPRPQSIVATVYTTVLALFGL